MRKGLLWILGVWFFSAGPLIAQSPPANSAGAGAQAKTDSATAGAQAKTDAGAATRDSAAGNGKSEVRWIDTPPECRIWARPDYLLWWVKNRPIRVPIVTTGDPSVGFDPNAANTVNNAGALGEPGTRVLLGGSDVTSPPFSGMRLVLGGWLTDEEIVGVEASGFALARVTKILTWSSNETGAPPLYFPISTGAPGGERGIPIADPLRGFSGTVGVNMPQDLWGAECNALIALSCNENFEFLLLTGFVYTDLREQLQIYNSTTDSIFDNVTHLDDSFKTINQFYGGQIGSRIGMQFGPCSMDITGKIALGTTYQVVDIQGAITQAGPNPLVPPGLGTFAGGMYAQPSNIGRRSENQFTVLTSLDLKFGYELGQRARIVVGYDILCWSRVVRPGNQIDHQVNLTQNAVLDPNGTGVLVGPARPAPLFNRSDLWAQGLSFGVEFRF